jgi:hypothetical protein
MDKMFFFGMVSVLALGTMLIGYQGITGALIDESWETYELGSGIFTQAPQHYPRFDYVRLAEPGYDPESLPSQEALTPEAIVLSVNKIPILQTNYNYALSLERDDIHTFSGTAGSYVNDPTEFLQGYLCAYAYKVMGAPLRCERVKLGFQDGTVTFARGYAPDEYIAYQAVGTDFAAVFVLANAEYGILAASPPAYLKYVRNR